MRYLLTASVLAVLALALALPAAAALYQWTDDDGVTHIVTSLNDVPEEYRDRVTQVGGTTQPGTATAQPAAPAPAEAPDPPAAEEPPAEPELPRFEVPYENETGARRVIIPVKFNDYVVAPMALDTGSPGMLISVDLAVKLGVFSRSNGVLFTEAGGIGGSTLAVKTIIDSVSVQQARDTFVPTTVTAPVSAEFDGLIGMDFLANYTLSIDTRRQAVVFQQVEPDPNSRGGHDEEWWRRTFEEFRASAELWRELARAPHRRAGSNVTEFLKFQARESERLLQKLDIYASDHAVPRHWR